MKVIIIGGGISGLSMALSLHQVGLDVRVYEAVGDLAPLGVGINLQPVAVRALVELGLAAELAHTGISTQELCLFNKFGQLIYSEPRGLAAGYNWPQYSIHRGHLQMLLVRAAQARIPASCLRTGTRLVRFEQRGNRVMATLRDTRTGDEEVDDADILVGADGIHSAVRQQLYPAEGRPRFAGQVLWRAAVDAEPVLGGRTMLIAVHFHQRFVLYPIGQAAAKPGQLLTNWICQMTVGHDLPPEQDWNRRVSSAKVLAAFGAWRFPWLDTHALIERTPEIFEFPLVDRDPVGRWSFGRVTLIGDAAHPMHPTGSQAGSQAIVDARALTTALLSTPDPVEALQRYEAERRPIMNDITLRNRRFGPEAAMQMVEERAPNGFSRIEDVISRDELNAIARSFSAAAGLDAATVNARPPMVRRPPEGDAGGC